MTEADLIARYDGRIPRYTSYPTAPHFTDGVGADTAAAWLRTLPDTAPLSLYLHVPFCERLCLYCGCNTTVVRREAPRRAYAETLAQEMRLVAGAIGRRMRLGHLHWGGGTPTALPADCMTELMDLARARFDVADDAEIAIEIDPTSLDAAHVAALPSMGVNRVSLGVQDFDPAVQAAIGRVQSYADTARCAEAVRAQGIGSLNLDLIYGLPHQSEDSVTRTARQALALGADRIAVFGYAHVPWMKRHQALIPDHTLPGPLARFAQARAIGQVLEGEGGYVAVGLDHYARPSDAMARALQGRALHRSFQGYTTDAAPVLIGIGASAIGSLPQGYAQNATAVPAYSEAIRAGRLATVRGVALTAEDRLRRAVIERLMCDLRVDLAEEAAAQGQDVAPLLAAAERLGRFGEDGLVRRHGSEVTVTEAGRPFVRSVASVFDAYLGLGGGRPMHAQAV